MLLDDEDQIPSTSNNQPAHTPKRKSCKSRESDLRSKLKKLQEKLVSLEDVSTSELLSKMPLNNAILLHRKSQTLPIASDVRSAPRR
jgi:hypothetical protein